MRSLQNYRILSIAASGVLCTVPFFLAVSLQSQEPVRVTRAHYVMGTIFEITAYGSDREATAQAIEKAFAAIRRADEIMSHYKPESDLMRLNREGVNGPVSVPASLYYVLAESLKYSELTGGAFDITVGPLVRLWERAAEEDRIPSRNELMRARSSVGPQNVYLLIPAKGETPGARVQFAREGVEINLGAIGKGWAIDRAWEILTSHGIRNAFLSAGTSTVYALGKGPGGRGWKVDIVDACREGQVVATVTLQDRSLSTSASTEQFWEIEGTRYSHILDPRTGRPVEPLASVTVVAPTATESDALSTAVYVQGYRDGGEMLRRLGREGVLVEKGPDGACRARVIQDSVHQSEFTLAQKGETNGRQR